MYVAVPRDPRKPTDHTKLTTIALVATLNTSDWLLGQPYRPISDNYYCWAQVRVCEREADKQDRQTRLGQGVFQSCCHANIHVQ